MSKPKNRIFRDGIVHATYRPRRNNYFALRCDGAITNYATDEALALTCLICWAKEQRNGQNRNDR